MTKEISGAWFASDPSDDLLPLKEGQKLNLKHQLFINEMIAHGNREIAYMTVYPNSSFNAAKVAACRLFANPVIRARIQEGRVLARQRSLDALKQAAMESCMDLVEKRRLLAQIMRREICTEKEVIKNADGGRTTKIKSDVRELMRAMALDNEMQQLWLSVVLD